MALDVESRTRLLRAGTLPASSISSSAGSAPLSSVAVRVAQPASRTYSRG